VVVMRNSEIWRQYFCGDLSTFDTDVLSTLLRRNGRNRLTFLRNVGKCPKVNTDSYHKTSV
jgi:hypothetical protein